MAHSKLKCPACQAGSQDGGLCPECTARLRKALLGIARLWPELRVTIGRRDRVGPAGLGVRNGGGSQPMPFRPEIADLADQVRNTVTTWVREITDADQSLPRGVHGTVPALTRWLAWVAPSLRLHPAAAELLADMEQARARIIAAVDIPPDTVTVVCPACGVRNRALAKAWTISCERCEAEIDVAAIRQADHQALEDKSFSPAELEELTRVPAATIRKWASRRRIHSDSSLGGVALYRLSDVLGLSRRDAVPKKTGRRETAPARPVATRRAKCA